MHPVLFHFDALNRTWTVTSYAACFAAAGVVLFIISMLIAPRLNERRLPVLICLIAAIPALFIGARLLFWATNRSLYQEHPRNVAALALGNFSMLGGLLLAAAIVAITARAQRRDLWGIADIFTPGAAVAIAILKLGCFLNGCCFGNPTELPWSVTFPAGSPAHLHQIADSASFVIRGPQPVHPVQLYEASVALIAAAIAIALLVRRAQRGVAFLAAATVYITGRLAFVTLRPADVTFTAPSWLYPATYVVLIATCIAFLRADARRFHTH